MKEFKEWSYNHYRNKVTNTCDHCTDYLEGIEEGWRAALEEVYKQLDYSEEHETIKDWIEKELNDNN